PLREPEQQVAEERVDIFWALWCCRPKSGAGDKKGRTTGVLHVYGNRRGGSTGIQSCGFLS
ncbi:MAG: hypothetical protein ACF8PG_02700, partial [Maioricimonas sp. JB045]